MGIAIGCVGMSFDDFCKCDHDEFRAICEAWRRKEENKNREEWERMRIMSAISIQPHVKNKITPKQLLPMPWDKDKPSRASKDESPEARKKRFEKNLGKV